MKRVRTGESRDEGNRVPDLEKVDNDEKGKRRKGRSGLMMSLMNREGKQRIAEMIVVEIK
jgi:hypothetical protein